MIINIIKLSNPEKNIFGLNYWDTVQNEMTILTDMLFTICVNEMQFNSNRY